MHGWLVFEPRVVGCCCGLTARCLQALDQLFVARRILGYSYVACFYLFDGVTYADDLTSDQNSLLKNLFEDAQGMLEMEVGLFGSLSQIIEYLLCCSMSSQMKVPAPALWSSCQFERVMLPTSQPESFLVNKSRYGTSSLPTI